MKTTTLITLGVLAGSLSFAAAQEGTTEKTKPERKIPAEVLEKFDKDGDGKLSEEEKAAMKEARKKEMLEKYDKDGDGKLSDEEKAAMKADRKKHRGGKPEKKE
ncbi:MAG: EF-hand domain-containing protein [Luteolibacter sp.]